MFKALAPLKTQSYNFWVEREGHIFFPLQFVRQYSLAGVCLAELLNDWNECEEHFTATSGGSLLENHINPLVKGLECNLSLGCS